MDKGSLKSSLKSSDESSKKKKNNKSKTVKIKGGSRQFDL